MSQSGVLSYDSGDVLRAREMLVALRNASATRSHCMRKARHADMARGQ